MPTRGRAGRGHSPTPFLRSAARAASPPRSLPLQCRRRPQWVGRRRLRRANSGFHLNGGECSERLETNGRRDAYVRWKAVGRGFDRQRSMGSIHSSESNRIRSHGAKGAVGSGALCNRLKCGHELLGNTRPATRAAAARKPQASLESPRGLAARKPQRPLPSPQGAARRPGKCRSEALFWRGPALSDHRQVPPCRSQAPGAAWKPRARIRRRPLGSPLPCRVKAPTTLSACPRGPEALGREPIGSHGAAFFCALTRCPARLSATPLESPPDSDNGLQKTPPCVSCQRRSKAHACRVCSHSLEWRSKAPSGNQPREPALCTLQSRNVQRLAAIG